MRNEKEVSYESTNVYSTLNQRTSQTKNIWVVCHGIGYLSRYFLKYFRHLDPLRNYIIAPQAPSRYYLGGKYEHVGASWATREHTEIDVQNALAYLDAIYEQEDLMHTANLVLFGYSQGVSVVSRWIARSKIRCEQLILHSGRIPGEIQPRDLDHLSASKINYIYGTEDPFIDASFLQKEKPRIEQLFPNNLRFLPFQGGHEIQADIITKISL